MEHIVAVEILNRPQEYAAAVVDAQETLLELIFSSLEAWDRVPNDHRAETPKRYLKALKEITTPEEFNFTTFRATSSDMITLAPISFYTLCAHHMVPFYGQAFISYVPDQHLAGLSKFARTVRNEAKGLWVQESLTEAIANKLSDKLQPQGVGVILQAEHMCMAMRGVEAPGVVTTTSTMRGVYADHSKTAKSEFMQMIANKLQ